MPDLTIIIMMHDKSCHAWYKVDINTMSTELRSLAMVLYNWFGIATIVLPKLTAASIEKIWQTKTYIVDNLH